MVAGGATREECADARSVRYREGELMASVLRTTDLPDARGTLFGYVGFDSRFGLEKATLKGGRIMLLESLRGAKAESSGCEKSAPKIRPLEHRGKDPCHSRH